MDLRLRLVLVWLGVCGCLPCLALAEPEDNHMNLQDPTSRASSLPAKPDHRLALGISYLGGQMRWNFSPNWAAEYQFQTGKASSDFGDVTANVFGVRAYRFFKPQSRTRFYVGPEVAFTHASAHNSSYSTSGFVVGGFGGFDYYLSRRLSVGFDIGPYLISLKERTTGMTQTNLDFVVNTTLNVHLF